MRVVAIPIRRVISLEQNMMRANHVRGIQCYFLPGCGVIVPWIIGVVICYDSPGPRGTHNYIFACVEYDVVFDQGLRRIIGEANRVSSAAGGWPRASVNIRVSDLDPEGIIDSNALTDPLRTLDVF